jgi:hypothetical protein
VSRDHEHLLRWYPPAWRDRYGDELTALMEDTYAAPGRVPRRARLRLVRAGLEERAREAGLVGSATDPPAQVTGGSLLVLCAWTLFLVAGALFGKFTDQWVHGTPVPDRAVPSAGYGVVLVAAVVSSALVVAATLLVGPGFVRLIRAGRWREVRGPVWRAVVAALVAGACLGGTLGWARHLSAPDRNGGLPAYSAAFVLLGLTVVGAMAMGTVAAVAVARRVELGHRRVWTLGRLALGVTAAMVLIFGGIVSWWAAEAAYAPRVLANGIGNGVVFSSNTAPPTLLAAGFLMVVGLALAAAGSLRVLRGLREGNHPAT